LLVGFDVRCDPLPFTECFQSGVLHRRDVNEHVVAVAVIRLYEAVSALSVEEFDRAGHCYREIPVPWLRRRSPRHSAQYSLPKAAIWLTSGRGWSGNRRPPREHANVRAVIGTLPQVPRAEGGLSPPFKGREGGPVEPRAPCKKPRRELPAS